MVRDNKVSAVLVSTDLEQAQRFYQDKVGLTLSPATIKNHLVFECGGGTSLLVYGRPSGNKADRTQVRFWSTERRNRCRRARHQRCQLRGVRRRDVQDDHPHRHLRRHRELRVVQGSRRRHNRLVPTRVIRSLGSDRTPRCAGRHRPQAAATAV